MGEKMKFVNYSFESLAKNISENYFFQAISNRKLSNIYHSHDFYEFIVILQGNCTQIINEKEYFCDKGTLTVLCPNDRHKVIGQSKDVNLVAVSVSKEEVRRFEELFNLFKNPFSCCVIKLTSKQLLPFVNLYYSKSEAELKLILSNIAKIQSDYFCDCPPLSTSIENAVALMQKRENMRGGIDRFAELSGYSKTHLSRILKNQYNTTPHEFILNIRLNEAYNALMLSDVNLEELSFDIGYESFSHFQKIFKEKFGLTPASLRRKYRSSTI